VKIGISHFLNFRPI